MVAAAKSAGLSPVSVESYDEKIRAPNLSLLELNLAERPVVLVYDRPLSLMIMNPTIMKFGGTSVQDAAAFARVANIVSTRSEAHPVIIVSAISGMTDALITAAELVAHESVESALAQLQPHFDRHAEIANQLLHEDSEKTFLVCLGDAQLEISNLLEMIASSPASKAALLDAVVSLGEQLSSALLAAVLRESKIEARQIDARQCIVTNDDFGCATPLISETFERARATLGPLIAESLVPVLGGFIASTATGETTTLGRGGSDYSAALIGAALSANEIQIWTDVTGVLTADPKIVSRAQTIPRLSYSEAAELAYFGAKVLHPKTIQPAVESSIPVRICNSRSPEEQGTLVGPEKETVPRAVKAIAHKTGVTTIQITSARMLGAYGFLRALFEVFDRHRTAVDVVTTSEVSVSLSLDDLSALPAILEELDELGAVKVERSRAIVCVVGEGLHGTPGIAARVFGTISDINVTLISQGASSINLTFAIEEERVNEAVVRLHQAFFEESKAQSRQSRIEEIGRRVSAYSAY